MSNEAMAALRTRRAKAAEVEDQVLRFSRAYVKASEHAMLAAAAFASMFGAAVAMSDYGAAVGFALVWTGIHGVHFVPKMRHARELLETFLHEGLLDVSSVRTVSDEIRGEMDKELASRDSEEGRTLEHLFHAVCHVCGGDLEEHKCPNKNCGFDGTATLQSLGRTVDALDEHPELDDLFDGLCPNCTHLRPPGSISPGGVCEECDADWNEWLDILDVDREAWGGEE